MLHLLHLVNLLHDIYGVCHVNLLPEQSNGLEILFLFADGLEEEDYFRNALLNVGDTVILDNCGFNHVRNVEPVLRDMLTAREVGLIYQPPYHPQLTPANSASDNVTVGFVSTLTFP